MIASVTVSKTRGFSLNSRKRKVASSEKRGVKPKPACHRLLQGNIIFTYWFDCCRSQQRFLALGEWLSVSCGVEGAPIYRGIVGNQSSHCSSLVLSVKLKVPQEVSEESGVSDTVFS